MPNKLYAVAFRQASYLTLHDIVFFITCLTLKKMSQKVHATVSRTKIIVDKAAHTSTAR